MGNYLAKAVDINSKVTWAGGKSPYQYDKPGTTATTQPSTLAPSTPSTSGSTPSGSTPTDNRLNGNNGPLTIHRPTLLNAEDRVKQMKRKSLLGG